MRIAAWLMLLSAISFVVSFVFLYAKCAWGCGGGGVTEKIFLCLSLAIFVLSFIHCVLIAPQSTQYKDKDEKQIFNKKDKLIRRPFYILLNWLPIGTIPIYKAIIEGDYLYILIPVFNIFLYKFLYQKKLVNKFQVITSMFLYVILNLFLLNL
jgi:hypothetical protein